MVLVVIVSLKALPLTLPPDFDVSIECCDGIALARSAEERRDQSEIQSGQGSSRTEGGILRRTRVQR